MPWDLRVGGGSATKTWAQIQTEVLDYTEGPHTITAPSTTPALTVKQNGNAGASTSTGGAINLDNSGSTGAGIVVYSTQASPSGRLIVARANNPTFAQTAMYAENAGTGHALHAANTYSGTNTTGGAGNFTSTNPGASSVQISGVETGRGSLKITHTGPGTAADANASAISCDLQGASTASKGIFVDSVAQGTTGDLLDLRNNGNRHFTVRSRTGAFTTPEVVLGNGGPMITICTGTPEAAVTAVVGSLALRTDGAANTSVYRKEAGTGNTGWVAISSAAGTGFTAYTASGGDDTTALQAVITAAAATGIKILLPSALYQVTTLTIPASAKPVMLVGMGTDATTIREFTSAVTSSVDLIDVNATGGKLVLRDLTLQGPTSVSGAFIFNLIHQGAGTGGLIDCENVRLYKFGYGIWSENTSIRLRNFTLDGGSAGTALGSSVGGQGILHAPTALGWLDLERGEITNCGHVSSNLYHGLYIEPIVNSTVDNVRFTNLYGTGFHSQHFGATASSDFINYSNCYFGPAITALTCAALASPEAIPMNISDCVFEMQDNALIVGDVNCNVKFSRCTFLGASGGNQQIALVTTGNKITIDACDFLGSPPSQIYCNSNGNIIKLTNNEFSGSSTNDVEFDTGMTTTELYARGNRHSGTTSGSNFRLASGKRVTLEDNIFTGAVTGSCVNNLSGSTLITLNVANNDFSQSSGTSVTLTATPTNLRRKSNYGSAGYRTENGGTFSSTPGAVSTLNIAHGLVATPTVFSVERGDADARLAPAYHVTATSTNVVLTFTSALTAGTAYDWNWLANVQP